MNPKSGKAASADAPDAPAEAEDAVVADPGEQGRIEAAKKEEKKKEKESQEEEEDTHYIDLELKDADGNPMGGEEYCVELPNGKIVSGYLDDEGKAHLDGIPSGDCKVSFPGIHDDEWQSK